MIRLVTLKGFKRFADTRFEIPGHAVLAGPNNTGKTTLLQAIAAWELGFRKWQEIGDFNTRRNGYQWKDLERLAFSAVAVRSFEMLWRNRQRAAPFEIGIQVDGLPPVTLEFRFKADGLMQVRPKADAAVNAWVLQDAKLRLRTTFIPAMSGLSREERRLADPEAIDDLLAQGRPGEVLRNLLVIAHKDDQAWRALNNTIARLFDYELLPPQSGAVLICEYRHRGGDNPPKFDIASAGSGFLQVLLLLALLLTQHRDAEMGSLILLIDEPDAHLHLILQRSIYGELRSVAASRQAQLFVATHSEMIVNNVEARELYLMYGTPRLVASDLERAQLVNSFGALTHSDILEAEGARGALYTEDFTDIDILEAFARVLNDDAALKLLSRDVLTKSSQAPLPDGLGEFSPQKHWEMLKLIRADFPALELLDGDSKNQAADSISGTAEKMQRIRWRRYEIESYLIHPAALQRFVEKRSGGDSLGTPHTLGQQQMTGELEKTLQKEFMNDPTHPIPLVETYFRSEPVSKTLLPGLMQAAGLNVPKREFYEIAALFDPQEVHPEIVERLGQIKQAFGV
jgi:predicted ATPase